MLPISFPGSKEIGKPESMTDEQCYSISAKQGLTISPATRIQWFMNALESINPELLRFEGMAEVLKTFFNATLQQVRPVHFFGVPAYHFVDQDNFPQWLTVWKPCKEDLEALNRGGAVALKSLSEYLVPMALYTLDENLKPTE